MSSQKPHSFEESLHATVAYFDIFDYPLTPQELWTFLLYAPEGHSISEMFEKSRAHPSLEWSKGFIHMKGRESCVQERIDRYVPAGRKMRKALRFARWCSFIPGVSMIAVCNTLAFSHAHDGSDIDLFIVSKKGYLWFVRAACIVFSLFFGPRLSKKHMRDALCLSFFASSTALDLSALALPTLEGIDDVYLALWVSRLVPLYDEGGVAEAFWEANRWAAGIIPQRMLYMPNHMRRIRHGIALKFVKMIGMAAYAPFCFFIEYACKAIQQKKFPIDIRKAANMQTTGVVITDDLLKFHLTDRREYFQRHLIESIRSYRALSL